jgi:hypothetical protein
MVQGRLGAGCQASLFCEAHLALRSLMLFRTAFQVCEIDHVGRWGPRASDRVGSRPGYPTIGHVFPADSGAQNHLALRT